MVIYKNVFYRLLQEDMFSGDGGALGSFESGGSGDFYAPGDNRMPSFIGSKRKKRKKSKKHRKNKGRKGKNKGDSIPIQRR